MFIVKVVVLNGKVGNVIIINGTCFLPLVALHDLPLVISIMPFS